MNKIIPVAAKLLSENGGVITKAAAPAVTTSQAKYSTKSEAAFEVKRRFSQFIARVLGPPASTFPIIKTFCDVKCSDDKNDQKVDQKVDQNNGRKLIKSPFKLHKLDHGPSTKTSVSSEEALDMYRKLTLLRRLETAAGNLYKEKIIRGFCHLYSGQEAVAVGMKAAMREQDTVITAYRCHGWTYLMGVSAVGVLAELTGRGTGCSRGKGGSMHLYGRNFYGGNGIVGAQVPLGAGLAFAHKYRGDGGVNFALYGDGAANQGQLFEAYNIAKLWNLPSVFVCENNGYGMGTSKDRSSASTEYYTRGDYIPGVWVDGMDVLATKEATRFAIDYCTSGKGPLVIEMETYRYGGHSMSDPGTSYRTRDEVQEVRQTRDPITSFKDKLLANELATPDQLKEIDIAVRKEVDEATKQAKSDAEIGVEELSADIYVNNLHSEIRGVTPMAPLQHISVAQRA